MTPDEKDLLARFLQQLTTAQAGQKDEEAERLIREACARQPDAAYLLVQRAMQLDQAFQASQAQATKLQLELDRTRVNTSGGFLNDPHAWGSRATQPPAPGALAQPPATAAAAAPARPAPSPWGSNLLGTMATTAAGVVAGSFLFQGIQGLMHKNDTPTAKPEHTAHDPAPGEHASAPHEETDATDTYAEAPDDSGSDFA
jgi:hypothetical protein